MATGFATGLSAGAEAAMDALAQQQQGDGQKKVAGAARDFEALLLGQLLRASRSEGGWLGTEEDDAGDAAVGFGEEQLALSMASSGGLGLSKLIQSGIRSEQKSENQAKAPA